MDQLIDQKSLERAINEFAKDNQKITDLLIKMTELQIKMVNVEAKLTEQTGVIAAALTKINHSENRLLSIDGRLSSIEGQLEKKNDKLWDLFKGAFPYLIAAAVFYALHLFGLK